MAKLLPTTRAQVSGHKFMRRRMEHGLIFGDIRMIHGPLASRRRATILDDTRRVYLRHLDALAKTARANAAKFGAPAGGAPPAVAARNFKVKESRLPR